MSGRRWIIPGVIAVAGLALTAGLYLYNVVAGRQIRNSMFVPKPTKITPEVRLLQEYVRVNTSNPPGNETAGARFLADRLERGGVHAEIIESAPGRGNVYARIRGRRRGEGLLLLNHIDVVPADPKGWSGPPFEAAAKFNTVYGRGVLDMKGIAICQLEAFLDLAGTHRTPERDVVFLGTADEETNGGMGVQWLLAHRPDVFEGIRYVLNEGGINETEQERPTYLGVEIGSKMVVKTRLRAPSRQAMQRTRIALEPFLSPRDPDRLLPEVRSFLHDLAPHRREQGPLLNDVLRTIAEGKFWLLSRPYQELTQNVVYAGAVNGDERGATMEVNLFDLPDENPDARIAWLRGVIQPYGATIEEVLEKNGPSPLSPRNTPMFSLLTNELRRQYGNVSVGSEILAVGMNDSRYLRQRGIVCYGMWPFMVDFFQTTGIHGVDERVRIDWFMDGVALMKRLVAAYAFQAAG